MVFSVGEDLFSVMVIVGLVVVFVIALAHSYHVYAERRNACEDFDLALDVAERIKYQVLAEENGQLGQPELSRERLENYSRILAIQGVSLRVEVKSLDGEIIFAHGPEPNVLGQYFSPPVGVCLPAVQSPVGMCELSVWIWRG